MEYVTIDEFNGLKREMKQMRRELLEVRSALIPEVKISAAERKELDGIYAEMKAGKETDWRNIARSR